VLPDEFQFTKDMIPENIDLGVFGHIHIHQQVQKTPPVIYTGAVERIDWGECGEEKGFVSISLGESLEWKFEKVPVREMAKIAVRLNSGDSDPTAKIISSLPADVAGAMLRIDIQTGEATRKRIDGRQLAEKLAPAFDYELRYSEASGEKASAAAFSSDPFELVRDFIDANYKSDPRHGDLQKRAREILEEVLK
jgi:DNA repair exonuclease SbcCD nuclease subunit